MAGSNILRSFYSSQAALTSYYPRIRRLLCADPKVVLITSMPKSGSTFLSKLLASLLGYQHGYFSFAYFNVEQELFVPKILDAYGQGTVVQQHFKANEPNLRILKQFELRPVVLVRNLADVLVSVRDHLLRERTDNIPSLFPPAEFKDLSIENQLDYLIKFFAPWLIEFYVSWKQAEDCGTEMLWMRYEDCIDDWSAAVARILDFNRLAVNAESIARQLTEDMSLGNTRLNKGIVGRGKQQLTAGQLEALEALMATYPQIEFG